MPVPRGQLETKDIINTATYNAVLIFTVKMFPPTKISFIIRDKVFFNFCLLVHWGYRVTVQGQIKVKGQRNSTKQNTPKLHRNY